MYKKILVALIACGFMSMAYGQSIVDKLEAMQTSYHKPDPHHPKPKPKKPRPEPKPEPKPEPEPRPEPMH